MHGCEWLDNAALQDSGKYPCEYVKKNWNEDTMPTPYPCLAIENYVATQNLAVTPAAATKESYWGTAVPDMQSNIAVSGNKITGTLKYVDAGALATDWGAGNFLALKFTIPEGATSCKVGLDPSEGSGLVELDEDKDGVFKITDSETQKFVIVTTDGVHTLRQEFSLTDLTCLDE